MAAAFYMHAMRGLPLTAVVCSAEDSSRTCRQPTRAFTHRSSCEMTLELMFPSIMADESLVMISMREGEAVERAII